MTSLALSPKQRIQFRDLGRLFSGAAPTEELRVHRMQLLDRWDKIVKSFKARNRQHLLRYLRMQFRKYDKLRDGPSDVMRFMEELRAHNEAEQQEKDRQHHGEDHERTRRIRA